MISRKTLLGLMMMLFILSLNFAFAQNTISWDFENGNDHGFTLHSVIPATPADDNPDTISPVMKQSQASAEKRACRMPAWPGALDSPTCMTGK